MKNKNRKRSWEYLDRAWQIQFPPKHLSKKLTLLFLAAKSDDLGRSFHGYRSICAHLGFQSKSTVSNALKYLRDELGILNWQHGSGGFEKKNTNRYELNLDVMGDLIAAQGVFDPETGKLKRYAVESTECTESGTVNGLSVESTQQQVESTGREVESIERTKRVQSVDSNPQEPTVNTNPQYETSGPGSSFCASSSPSSSGTEVGERLAPAPLLRRPPVESSGKTSTECPPGSLVTAKFMEAHEPVKGRKLPKTPKDLAQGIHQALVNEAPDAPVLQCLAKTWESDWTTSIGFATSRNLASLDELRELARFAIDRRLPRVLAHGVPGLIGNVEEIREEMKKAEVTQ